jgi:hypothetical protein
MHKIGEQAENFNLLTELTRLTRFPAIFRVNRNEFLVCLACCRPPLNLFLMRRDVRLAFFSASRFKVLRLVAIK